MQFFPKIYLTDGIVFYVGYDIQTVAHKHHALEIVITFDKPFHLAIEKNKWDEHEIVLIKPDVPHQLNSEGKVCLFIFLDDEQILTQFLKDSVLKESIIYSLTASTISEEIVSLKNWYYSSQTEKDFTLIESLYKLIQKIAPISLPKKSFDDRIQKATEYIQKSLLGDVSLKQIAEKAHLSEGRLVHLFKEQTGIPIRKYVLWHRIQEAVNSILKGHNLTRAAHQAGFYDSAHFTRTFVSNFGVAPSEIF